MVGFNIEKITSRKCKYEKIEIHVNWSLLFTMIYFDIIKISFNNCLVFFKIKIIDTTFICKVL